MKAETSPAARVARNALRTLVLVSFTQLPFWLMQSRQSILRPVFNLDLFVALMIMLRSARWGMVALVAAWLVEVFRDASINYHFQNTADFLDAARFMSLVNLGQILSWTIVLAVALMSACAVGAYVLARRWPPPVSHVIAFGVFAFVAATVNGSSHVLGLGRDRLLLPVYIAGSPGWGAIHTVWTNSSMTSESMVRSEDPITFEHARAWHAAQPRSTVLLVLVESMGYARSAAIRDWLASRLDTPSIERRWTVQQTSEPFVGPTIYGELRVLCGLRGHYSRLTPADESRCLPRMFIGGGGQAIGLHGFSLRMFDRQVWWRDLGLQPETFRVDGMPTVDKDCSVAFPGVCDSVVLRRAVELADAPSRLVYVVTLDTHLPLPPRSPPLPPGLAERCRTEHIAPLACVMVERLGGVLDSLRDNLDRMQHPPLVLVVGDHAPPFVETAVREAFDQGHVPGFILEPRQR
jgi:hypothetical protein